MASITEAQTPPPVRRRVRMGLLAVAAGLIAIFVIGWQLRPYDDGGRALRMETHTQLGLPPCRFVTLFGKPCPSCGLTTSVSLLMHGDIGGSVQANWVGTLLAGCWLAMIPWSVWGAVRGRYLGIRSLESSTYVLVFIFTVLLMLRWGGVLLQHWLAKR